MGRISDVHVRHPLSQSNRLIRLLFNFRPRLFLSSGFLSVTDVSCLFRLKVSKFGVNRAFYAFNLINILVFDAVSDLNVISENLNIVYST